MRKRMITPGQAEAVRPDQGWLNLDTLAQVEVTSEDAEHPIESALVPDSDSGWRAASPGKQTIRLIFDQPQQLKRVRLVFEERERERTQEFLLRWSPDGGKSYQEIVRQQWNFSPTGTVKEVEDYGVELSAVTVLELIIDPDKSGGESRASLEQLRLA
ncbi:MAG: discoidin domain-containing protein [Acidobacteriota bacterium]